MLNVAQLQRLISTSNFERMIDRVLENGRSDSLAIRLRLNRPEALQPSALGLAMQRLCELSYASTPFIANVGAQLIHLQRSDGHFESGSMRVAEVVDGDGAATVDVTNGSRCARRASSVATAIAVRGLLAWRGLLSQTGGVVGFHLHTSIDRGIEALARAQDVGGSIGCDAVEDAIVLWQLGHHESFRNAVRMMDLIEAVEVGDHDRVMHDLHRLAQCAAA